ncbi:MAG: ASCH domain-containing protein [Candidatus ainarchaeum sp.]|nr:ASCH domain-containing protein [Candidatus ainarchaeum sp.]
MNVLLSIKPEYAEKIFSGEKQYEYRRLIFKNRDISQVIVYASSPIKKVIGEFEIKKIFFDDIESLWNKTKYHSGISEENFFKYFLNKERGYAIKIGKFFKYEQPLCLKEKYGLMPPQSFAYIT